MNTTAHTPAAVPEHNGVRFFRILMAFQQFAGKPLKVTDFADVLTPGELCAIEGGLARVAKRMQDFQDQDQPLASTINELGRAIVSRLQLGQ